MLTEVVCAEEVSQAFEHYDDDRSGQLTHEEYKKALRDLRGEAC